jgi:aconitate hydratase
MVNGIGVLGWGVGGIEAEGVMFGVPILLRVPDVIGVRLSGSLPEGSLGTDLALVVTERLRREGVAGEFVEFFGPGVGSLGASERAVIANMAPEYGATTGYFPIDHRTLAYLRSTGRSPAQIELVETYARVQELWYAPDAAPRYTRVIEIDISAVRPSLAGPRRPQDRLDPARASAVLRGEIRDPGPPASLDDVPNDAVAIAAIASCTNTTDLGLLVAAGIVARNARRLGLSPPPWVKTSFTPGSPATARRLGRVKLLDDLEALGFGIAGFGCATCIGNAGPLLPKMAEAILRRGIKPVAVLSGNRNFPGRVHTQIDAALLASPPLVIAYALAGRALLDVTKDPIGTTPDGRAVRLADLWPHSGEVEALVVAASDPADVEAAYAEAEASRPWHALEAPVGARFAWDLNSTYLRRPPFVALGRDARTPQNIIAHPLLVLGDDVTTDHVSPAGAIPPESEAGRWLIDRGEDPTDLNVYASRRGNWEVMLRGLFTNRTLVNQLCPHAPAGYTVFADGQKPIPIWRAAEAYADEGMPVVILAGERYGTGSSRDWAAKGPYLLGVRAVLANSFERIHRSNLVGMGILPLRLPRGWRPNELGIKAGDTLEIAMGTVLEPLAPIQITLRRKAGGAPVVGIATALVQTAQEIAIIQAGGIIPMILRRIVGHDATPPLAGQAP